MRAPLRRLLASQQAGLVLVILALGIVLTLFAGSHPDRATGQPVNNFLNSNTLMQTATDASFFAIMAVGATIVIISGGIDLSVGSVYALAGVSMGLILRVAAPGIDGGRGSDSPVHGKPVQPFPHGAHATPSRLLPCGLG